MSAPLAERKADVEKCLVELEFELNLAVSQGLIKDHYRWVAAIEIEGKDIFVAILQVSRVAEDPDGQAP